MARLRAALCAHVAALLVWSAAGWGGRGPAAPLPRLLRAAPAGPGGPLVAGGPGGCLPAPALRLRGGHPSRKKLLQQAKAEQEAAAQRGDAKKAAAAAPADGDAAEGRGGGAPAKAVLKTLKKTRKRGKREAASKKKREKAPFRPWVDKPDKDEVLVPALEAYDCLFPMNVEWPALSFDFMEDPAGPRRGFPIAATVVCGSQAETPEQNKVTVMEIFGLRRFRKRKREEESDSEPEEGVEESSSDDFEQYVKGIKVEPKVHHYSAPHNGTVNRIRCMPQQPTLVATWSESGKVHAYNMSSPIESRLVRTLECHACEGFALGWSRACAGRLASGDVGGRVYVHEMGASAESMPSRLLSGHTASVEDLCWSPSEGNVLATCSADRSIRFWDLSLPEGKECGLVIEDAHDCDVNALSWNHAEQHLIVSGGDDGIIKVWDLGALKRLGKRGGGGGVPQPVAVYAFHKAPINSLDWHPTEPSVFMAACRDDSVSVWDLSVERDEGSAEVESKFGLEDLPPQLLFLHQGQKELSEAKWHPLIPTVAFSSAADGFNIWRATDL